MPVLRHVYDSTSGTFHDVEVSREVYNYYQRSGWAIRRNNTRFYANEIQFSSLIGGSDQAYERFSELGSSADDPQQLLCDAAVFQGIVEALLKLSPADRRILRLLVIEGHTERWYAKRTGMPQKTVHNRKCAALKKLRRHIGEEA